MPVTYTMDQSILHIKVVRKVEYNPGLAILKGALNDARKATQVGGAGSWHVLINLTEAMEEDRSADELRGVAMVFAQQSDILTGKMALVAADRYRYGLSKVFSVFAEQTGQEPRVFGTLKEAESWLRA